MQILWRWYAKWLKYENQLTMKLEKDTGMLEEKWPTVKAYLHSTSLESLDNTGKSNLF